MVEKTPWNKGLKGEEYRKHYKNGFSGATLGHRVTEATKEKISQSNKGKAYRGRGWKHTEETKRKIGKSNSIALKGKKYSKERIRKCLRRNGISSLEAKMFNIIQKYNLPYKFVGNGQFSIGRKVPDFINCNGEKIAIEVFYPKHKEQFRGGLEKWKEERSRVFNRYGWKIEYFDVVSVNEQEVLRRIG